MLNKQEIISLKTLHKYLINHSENRHDGDEYDEDLSDVVSWCSKHPKLKNILGLATPKDLKDYHEGSNAIFSQSNPDSCGCTYDGFVNYLNNVLNAVKHSKQIPRLNL